MGQTISEKIFSKSVGRTVKAGDFVDAAIDVAMIHDITGPLAVKPLRNNRPGMGSYKSNHAF